MSKIVDREGLKAFRERLDEKYVIEGEYSPQTSVGLSDNLTPYSEDSGTEQSNPFISNGTGTNNNQEIVTVGDYGLLRIKNGNTVCVNQQLQNNDFTSTSNWNGVGGTLSVSNNICSLTISSPAGFFQNRIRQQNLNFIAGHKYLICAYVRSSSATKFGISFNSQTELIVPTANTWYLLIKLITVSTTGSGEFQVGYEGTPNANDILDTTKPFVIDLTQWFNGDIPTDLLNNPSHFSWYYNGSLAYNTGTLVNANGVKLVSTNRNLFDDLWELGGIDTQGNPTTFNAACRSKNYIQSIANLSITISVVGLNVTTNDSSVILCEYDKSKHIIKRTEQSNISGANYSIKTFTLSSNTYFIKFYLYVGNMNFNNNFPTNKVVVSLYYTPEQGGEGYDKYYPYETPYEVNTGNEVLRSAGSVYDYKEPNGTIHRVIGVVDLGTLTFYSSNANGVFGVTDFVTIVGAKSVASGTIANIRCALYIADTSANVAVNYINKTIGINPSGVLVICDTSLANKTGAEIATALSGVYLYFELATPTTEQGTTFAENLPINDYGMLYWDSDIPQGNTIFFPINYKGFLDDMYSRVDGDSGKYVIDTELQASETQRDTIDTQLKNAIGGTLRQLLASSQSIDFLNTDVVDLGDLNWTYQSSFTNPCFTTDISVAKGNDNGVANILSTMYKVMFDSYTAMPNMNMQLRATNHRLYVTNTTYTDATTFKNAMKGVLLAYEKA